MYVINEITTNIKCYIILITRQYINVYKFDDKLFPTTVLECLVLNDLFIEDGIFGSYI